MEGKVFMFHNIVTWYRALQETVRPPGLTQYYSGAGVVVAGGEDLGQFGHVYILKVTINLEDRLRQNSQPGCHRRIRYFMGLSFTFISTQRVTQGVRAAGEAQG